MSSDPANATKKPQHNRKVRFCTLKSKTKILRMMSVFRSRCLANIACLMIIAQELVKEVSRLWGNKVLVLSVDESGPGFSAVPANQGLQLWVQLNAILVEIGIQLVSSQYLQQISIFNKIPVANDGRVYSPKAVIFL